MLTCLTELNYAPRLYKDKDKDCTRRFICVRNATVIVSTIVRYLTATAVCFWKYDQVKDAPENKGTVQFATNLNYYANLKETWLAFGKRMQSLAECITTSI